MSTGSNIPIKAPGYGTAKTKQGKRREGGSPLGYVTEDPQTNRLVGPVFFNLFLYLKPVKNMVSGKGE